MSETGWPDHRRLIGATLLLASAALAAGCDRSAATLPHGIAPPQQVALGRRLLAQYQCGSCHEIPGVPIAIGRLGPTLEHFGRRSYIAGHLPNGSDMLARWIIDPQALVPGTLMPTMGVSREDAQAMAAYLLQLR